MGADGGLVRHGLHYGGGKDWKAMNGRKVDIVVLDDDVDLLTSVAELLADTGYVVKGFSDPESAVEFAVDQQFSVGVFDFRLGSVKNGLDVVETLQAMGSKAEFVMVTADVGLRCSSI
jgi:DNA-binding NtrC family response regulator